MPVFMVSYDNMKCKIHAPLLCNFSILQRHLVTWIGRFFFFGLQVVYLPPSFIKYIADPGNMGHNETEM